MNNEIKEILDKLKNHIEHIRFANLTNYELRLFYDYIINLQEQLHQASLDIQELTERDIWCPSNCDKLTNLQKDLKYQKEMEEEYNKKHTKLMQDYSKLQEKNERLIKIARKMHTWIFLNTGNEQKVYDEIGLTDEENKMLGYSGQFILKGENNEKG